MSKKQNELLYLSDDNRTWLEWHEKELKYVKDAFEKCVINQIASSYLGLEQNDSFYKTTLRDYWLPKTVFGFTTLTLQIEKYSFQNKKKNTV